MACWKTYSTVVRYKKIADSETHKSTLIYRCKLLSLYDKKILFYFHIQYKKEWTLFQKDKFLVLACLVCKIICGYIARTCFISNFVKLRKRLAKSDL